MHARSQRQLHVGAMILSVLVPGVLAAQSPQIRVAGRVQAQYRLAGGDSSASFSTAGVNNSFEIRRLRIQADVRFADNIKAVIQPSFEMGSLRMRDAYVRVGVADGLDVTVGQEKSPFQRYELTSSNSLPSVERGVRILGLSGREGLNDILVGNGYASHDLGAFLDWTAPKSRFAVKVGVQNGSRESARDVNNAKSVFGRATATLLTTGDDGEALQVGASFASRDRAVCSTCTGSPAFFADSALRTTAFGFDLEWGGFRPGLHVIADFATGDNVLPSLRVDAGRNGGNVRNTADSNVVTFRALHVVGAYRFMTRGAETRLIKMLEPALRVDLTDPDTNTDNDGGVLITPAVNVYFASTVVLRAAFDVYRYKDAAGESRTANEFKVSWQANF